MNHYITALAKKEMASTVQIHMRDDYPYPNMQDKQIDSSFAQEIDNFLTDLTPDGGTISTE